MCMKNSKVDKVMNHVWMQEYVGAITVCDDAERIILGMNNRAVSTNQDQGWEKLIGTSLFGCRPEPSRTKLRELMKTQRINVYTIEKNGRKKLIYQPSWFKDGRYSGFVGLSLEIPYEIPHFVRDE